MEGPRLFRRRFIPDETVELKNDEILKLDEDTLLTRWKALKPRKDFTCGMSCLFLKKGWKISRVMDDSGNCLYTYCDIVDVDFDVKNNIILFSDLLVDVVVYDNGFVKVLDIAEVSDALDLGLITVDTAKRALRLLDGLLRVIYSGKFQELLSMFQMEALI
jgi:predicted RNA-binding protein associated with RNAse of E/G family